jgi:hypothetical protein
MKNKIVSGFLAIILIFCLLTMPCYAYSGYVGEINCIGDANSDGVIDSNDYAIIKAYVLYGDETEITPFGKYSSDVNLDGIVDGFDAIEIEVFLAENGSYVWY